MEQLCITHAELSPEVWFWFVAFVAGGAGRLAKTRAPKWLVPYSALVVALLLAGGAAVGCGGDLPAAVVMGLAAGGTAIGTHELLKKLAGRYLGAGGAAKALKLLGEAKEEEDK